MFVGYMRVSTADDRQSVDLQRDALVAAGVDDRHLHEDRASGALLVRKPSRGSEAFLDEAIRPPIQIVALQQLWHP